jgi:hypothetical protein
LNNLDGAHAINQRQFRDHLRLLMEQREAMNAQSLQLREFQDAMRGGRNLDPDAPLMQLLWQTMLPWNSIEE